MEPTTSDRPPRDAREPRGSRGRPRPHHPDHRARVRRLRHGVTALPAGRHRRDRVHQVPPEAGRLRPAPGRRPDDPRQAARAAASRPTSSTPSPTSIEKYVPLNKGHITTRQNIQLHHVPLPDAAEAIRELSDAGLSSREGCGNTVRNVTGDPWAGVCDGRALRPHPLRRRLRALLRAPPDDAADAAQDQDRVRRRARRRPRADRHPRHRLPRPRARRRAGRRGPRRRRHVDHAARRADALRVRRPRRRRVPQGRRGRLPDLRPHRTACASTAPAPASRCSSTSSASTRFREMVDEELQGDWVAERDFDVDGLRFDVDEEALAPPRRATLRLAERRPVGVRALLRTTTSRPSARPASRRSRSRSPAAT